MLATFPSDENAQELIDALGDEETQCQEMLARVARIADELGAATEESEANQRLSPASLALLKEHELLNMRLMKQLGGLELSIATQCKVLAALAEADSSSAWCAMVHNNGAGALAAFFPEETVKTIFADKIPVVAMVAAANGLAREVEGGYSVTGRWSFCSGFHNSDWLLCAAWIDNDPKREILMVVPKSEVTPHENWNVFGMRGTGSIDFSVEDFFVPARHAISNLRKQRRGIRIYSRPGILLASYEHAAVAWGLGRRALRLMKQSLARFPSDVKIREAIAEEIGLLSLKLEGAAAVMLDYFCELEKLTAKESSLPPIATKSRAAAAYVTEVALECATTAFRRAGSRAIFVPNPIEMLFRDTWVAHTHIVVNDSNYAIFGEAIIRAGPDGA